MDLGEENNMMVISFISETAKQRLLEFEFSNCIKAMHSHNVCI